MGAAPSTSPSLSAGRIEGQRSSHRTVLGYHRAQFRMNLDERDFAPLVVDDGNRITRFGCRNSSVHILPASVRNRQRHWGLLLAAFVLGFSPNAPKHTGRTERQHEQVSEASDDE